MLGEIMGQREDNSLLPEKRYSARRRVLLSGIITHVNGLHSHQCTIRQLSGSGAQIVVPTGTMLPSFFYLIVLRQDKAHKATVKWRKGCHVGLSLAAPVELKPNVAPELAHLAAVWSTHRA